MRRLIDANKIVYTEFPNTSEGFAFRSLIDKMPTVDAVEVVRCKDCENYVTNDKYVICGLRCEYTDKDWFCGNGIKRKDQNEAKSIKHGHWEWDGYIYDAPWQCSECGSFNEYDSNYCPDCGAKMGGKPIPNSDIITNKANTVTNNGNAMSTETEGETMPDSMMFPKTDDDSKQAYVIVDEDGNMECSNCGSSFCFDNYCAHCGAKLIGERKV